jgi:predicted anti-sigma-YlaC factor YlaD
LLFWLSLFPITTAWIGENHSAVSPSVLYGVVLLMAALAYAVHLIGIAAAFLSPRLAQGVYVLGALLWLVPDRRIERALTRR